MIFPMNVRYMNMGFFPVISCMLGISAPWDFDSRLCTLCGSSFFLVINLNIFFILSLCPHASSTDPSPLLTWSLLTFFLILIVLVYSLLSILHNNNIKENTMSTLTSIKTPF